MITNLLSAKWYPFLFDVANKTDFLRTILFWLTVVLAITFTLLSIFIKNEKKANLFKFLKPFAVCYSLIIATLFLYLGFKEDGLVKILFYPLLIAIIATFVSLLILCFNHKKRTIIILSCIVGISFIAVLVCMGIYFNSGESENYNGLSITQSENFFLYLFSIIIIGIIVAIYLFTDKKRSEFDTKSIAYSGLCIAMSFALSYIRIVKLPQGGSITLCSLLPLCIYSYMFGVKKGIFAGLIYGVLQAIQDPYIVHPMQFLLDYPIAFCCIGVSGILNNNKILKPQLKFSLGCLMGGTFRFICHLISGVFAFSEYAYNSAGEQMNAWLYSITYNSFVFIDIALTIIVGYILLSSNNFLKQVEKYNQV